MVRYSHGHVAHPYPTAHRAVATADAPWGLAFASFESSPKGYRIHGLLRAMCRARLLSYRFHL
jgi:hypothetical protein